jgi:ribosomal-protein-alanine N-acetyltransferase
MFSHSEIILRKTKVEDLTFLFQIQLDEEANYLAAFTSKDSANQNAYLSKYTAFLDNPTINNQTILIDDVIVGSISKFEIEGDAEITYWIDKRFWGKGVATTALKNLLNIENSRPIFGRVAFDNISSQQVLEKCGFVKIGEDKGFANARQTEIEEFIYKLT